MQDATGSNKPFLDSHKNNCNTFCGRWTVKGRVEKDGQQLMRYARLGCKKWNCPVCGPRRARQLRHSIIGKARELDLTRFLTLTLDPRACSADHSARYIRECWRKFRVYLKRKALISIKFIAILEFQKSGYAHLHILIDRYIEFRWIQSAWQAVGGGHHVNIKMVDIQRVARYLSKYLTKEIFLSDQYQKCRRFTTSVGMMLLAKSPKGAWKLLTVSLDYLLSLADQQVQSIGCREDGSLDWFCVPVSISP